LPGTQKLNKVSETEYEGEINIRVGPIVGVFSGRLMVSNEIPPESCTLTVEGAGKAGFLNGSGDVHFTEQGEDKTLMKYEGEAQIGGKLASVGQRLIEMTSKSLTKKGLETINQTMQERRAKK
jgi:carbon monoxide dehydrogenase subunit G